mgnify:FL=1
MKAITRLFIAAAATMLAGTATPSTVELTDEQVDNLVERSYQYVAMYNVNNKFALKQGGWNSCDPDTELKDHTMREIARPNNDTL